MNTSQSSGDREIVSTRVVAATPELVFQAIREPERLARWWGPKGFRNIFHEFDFQPGGVWRFDMHGTDGTVYLNKIIFESIEPDRLVLFHEETMHRFRLTIGLNGEGEGTRVTWRMVFDDAAECERVKAFVPQCNEENFDRLEAELDMMLAGRNAHAAMGLHEIRTPQER